MGARRRLLPATAPSVRRLVVGLAALLTLGLLVVPAQGSDVAGRPPDGVFVFDGRGFGHGRGLSQYGAYGAALQGLSHAQILAFYYAGTVLGTAPSAQRRVLLTGEDGDLVVSNGPGLAVRDEASGAVVGTGGRGDWSQVRVRVDGLVVRVEALQGAAWVSVLPPSGGPIRLEGPPVLTLHHPAGLRSYRGALTAALSGQPGKPLYVVNTVGLDDYVRGVVPAEMPSSWHPEALKAQTVAARSYGMQPCPQRTAYPATGLYDVVDTTSCQVYGGAGAERTSTNQAVTDTAGQVLRLNGSVVRTEFSASNGGRSLEGGTFAGKQDPYDAVGAQAARSTVHRWTGVKVPAAKLEQAFGTGLLREIRVLSRDGFGEWGGRVQRVRLVGDSRTVEVTGDQVRSAAGLRSRWFDLVSPIDSKHAALGGDTGLLGPAIAAEAELPGGRFRPYRSGSIYWTSAGAFEVHGAVLSRWGKLGWEGGPLGYPLTDELSTPNGLGRYNHFQRGSIYWTPQTGAWAVQGAIRATWGRLGWESSGLGFPMTDELATPDRAGRFNHFQGGSVYWSPTTPASAVLGSVRATWAARGWETGPLGYPLTDELGTPDGRGRYNHFQGGSVYWSPTTPAAEVLGEIRQKWAELGWARGSLGYPATGERAAPDAIGRYNHFQGGSIYASPSSGAHEVRGAIRSTWAGMGWERSSLGYPVSDEYAVPGGRRSDFQRGSLVWDATTHQVRVI